MIEREGDVLFVNGPVNLSTVPELSVQAEQLFQPGVKVVDFSKVTEIDSSAVALALECKRLAARKGLDATLRHLPDAMLNLAKLYGVADLVR